MTSTADAAGHSDHDTLAAVVFWMLVRRHLRLLVRPVPVGVLAFVGTVWQPFILPFYASGYGWLVTTMEPPEPFRRFYYALTTYLPVDPVLLITLLIIWSYLRAADRLATESDLATLPITPSWFFRARILAVIAFLGCLDTTTGIVRLLIGWTRAHLQYGLPWGPTGAQQWIHLIHDCYWSWGGDALVVAALCSIAWFRGRPVWVFLLAGLLVPFAMVPILLACAPINDGLRYLVSEYAYHKWGRIDIRSLPINNAVYAMLWAAIVIRAFMLGRGLGREAPSSPRP